MTCGVRKIWLGVLLLLVALLFRGEQLILSGTPLAEAAVTHAIKRPFLHKETDANLDYVAVQQAGQKAAGQEAAGQESAGQEAAGQKAAGQEAAGQDAPKRIIALAPHLSEMVSFVGAGANQVGRVEFANYPDEVALLPVIGNAYALNFEKILALQPDLILFWDGGTPSGMVERLKGLGLPLMGIKIRTLGDLRSQLHRLKQHLNTDSSEMQNFEQTWRVMETRAAPNERAKPKVFVQLWSEPLWTVGRAHLLNDLLARCGAENLFADIASAAVEVREETVLARHPDKILYAGEETEEVWKKHWENHPSLAQDTLMVNPDWVLRPGPRALNAMEQICNWVTESPAAFDRDAVLKSDDPGSQ
jgi:ABC-type Fe3+-hydroxamate transport system substrate-binding protein